MQRRADLGEHFCARLQLNEAFTRYLRALARDTERELAEISTSLRRRARTVVRHRARTVVRHRTLDTSAT